MKRTLLFTLAGILLAGMNRGTAAERIVDGVGGVTNRYATIAAAITAASTGDTIRVLSGLYSEDPISISKRVILLGNGYRNINNGGTHISSQFNFVAGSTGSRVIGFRFIAYDNSVTISGANDILIANNFFAQRSGVYISSSSNDTVRNNIMFTTGNTQYCVYLNSTTNVVVCNNILRGASNGTYAVNTNNVGTTFVYNNFIAQSTYGFVSQQSSNSAYVIAGNIFYSVSNVSNGSNNALLYSGNLLWNSAGIVPGNPSDNASGDPTFVKFETGSGYIYEDNANNDSDLRIQTGSPAIDLGYPNQAPLGATYQDYHPSFVFGTARSDAGVYGGPFTFPYPLGAPTVPSVTKTTISPAVVAPGGTLNVNVTGSMGGFTGRNN